LVYNSLIVKIRDVPHPGVCFCSFDNARSEDIFLDWSEGRYNIFIKHEGETNNFGIVISKDRIKTIESLSTFCEPTFTVYRRYPEKSFL
jgi:hypothetical protein